MKSKIIATKHLTEQSNEVTIQLVPETDADKAALNAPYSEPMELYLKNSFAAANIIHINPPYYTFEVTKKQAMA